MVRQEFVELINDCQVLTASELSVKYGVSLGTAYLYIRKHTLPENRIHLGSKLRNILTRNREANGDFICRSSQTDLQQPCKLETARPNELPASGCCPQCHKLRE